MDSGDNLACFSGTVFDSRLKELYEEMDAAYEAVSIQSNFNCIGCDGAKCCSVDLIIHTFVEMVYLKNGLLTLDENTSSRIQKRSTEIVTFKEIDPSGGDYRNSVCAANFDGKCAIYQYRPMICRLAGIPHFIHRPDLTKIYGPGCPRFENRFRSSNPLLQIDRTPFYRRMAELEMEIIKQQGKRTQSLTISEILAN